MNDKDLSSRPENSLASIGQASEATVDFLPGFERHSIRVDDGTVISVRTAGRGRPVLLLHGNPQTLACWHMVAPVLAEQYAVVASDLRGYGDSGRPPSDELHAAYSKRRMALDQVEVMRQLGFERFAVVGHDRGGRVAHRMALDHPDKVERLAVLDIAPTATMYARTDREFATRYFWWFFLIQPYDVPERLIGSNLEYFLRLGFRGQSKTPGAPTEDLIREYIRCMSIEGSLHAVCEDYRASAGIDLEHDAIDAKAGKKLNMPLLAVWGAKGTVGHLYDVLETWREKATNVTGGPLDCGHFPQEEDPAGLIEKLRPFLAQ